MRLAEFILTHIEAILAEWETFARSVPPGESMDVLALRDHAADILRATARDMASAQSAEDRADKSKGIGPDGAESRRLDGASEVHAVGRVRSGFDLMEVVAEYRALRASVVRLWRDRCPSPGPHDLDDVTRFHECIDQSLAEAVRSYTRQVDRSRQMFLAILGHDLRNPLNSVMMSAQVLSETGQLDADGREVAAQMVSSAAAMGRLIADLLDFTGTGLGVAMPLSPAAADAGAICREVVDEVRAAHAGRTLRFQPHGDLTGTWDAARLRQVVSNLVGNAVQHGGGSGPVDVSADGTGPDVVLAVRNGGPPIPPDALPTLFDPLTRGTSPELRTQRRPGSIGLGLYIAREVATAHGGTIDVTSSAEDGTTFTVRLPRRRR